MFSVRLFLTAVCDFFTQGGVTKSHTHIFGVQGIQDAEYLGIINAITVGVSGLMLPGGPHDQVLLHQTSHRPGDTLSSVSKEFGQVSLTAEHNGALG